ncbi:hypothetical protein [Ferrovibrio sp.]|uniref:hypothetical protein n=1 Tax=Ferrovibrio sp. TaxID=1917215 RepID=UPI003D2A9B30
MPAHQPRCHVPGPRPAAEGTDLALTLTLAQALLGTGAFAVSFGRASRPAVA